MSRANGRHGAAGREGVPADSLGAAPVNQVGLAAYWFSLNFQTAALLTIVIPETLTRLAAQTSRTTQLARLAALSAVIAMLVPPLIGVVSDKIRARGGARRPLLVFGTLVNMGGLYAVMQSDELLSLASWFVVALIGQSIATAAYQAMMPEVVPRRRWGLASGYMAVASLAGTVAGLAVAGLEGPTTVYWTMMGTAGAGAAYTSVTVREPRTPLVDRPRVHINDWRRFGWVFVARFLVIFGQTILMTFVLYFFEDVLRVRQAAGGTALVAGMALLGAGISAFWMGRDSDRRDRAVIVALAGIPMAAAAIGFGIFPHPAIIIALAVLWGLGYGAFLSVDWALALDSIPDLANVARDLGIWGIASNLPAVVAPLVGGAVLAAYANPAVGYRVLFVLAGASFAGGSATVLAVRRGRSERSWGQWLLIVLIAALLRVYVELAYRVRVLGRLPDDPRRTLVVGNHLHDLEGMVIPAWLFWQHPWAGPVVSAASRRLFEPGFLATRGPRWLGPWLTPLNLGPLLRTLGVHPIEDHPLVRPPSSWAYLVYRQHGNLPLDRVFTPEARASLDWEGLRRLSDLWRVGRRPQEEPFVPHTALARPYRDEAKWATRKQAEEDLDDLAAALAAGATLYLTPEGRMTSTGRLGRFRAALDHLLPHARAVYLAASAYDPWAHRRLSLFTRLIPVQPDAGLRDQLLASRPVTLSQVLARELARRPEGGLVQDFYDAVRAPDLRRWKLFFTPDLERGAAAVDRALHQMQRLGIIILDADTWRPGPTRHDPRFGHVEDIVDAQAHQLAETVEAASRLAATPAAAGSEGQLDRGFTPGAD
jgi:MFS family permease